MRDIKLFIKKEFLLLLLLLMLFFDLNQKGFYMCFILAFYFITIKIFSLINSFDKLGILLILFSISYSIIYSFNYEAFTALILVYAISPITFYAIGKYFSTKYRSYNVYFFLFLFLSIGYSLIPAISIIYSIIENGFVGERAMTLLTRTQEEGGTVLGSYFTMNIAAIGTIFVQSAKKIENRIKLITLLGFIISLLCVLRVASRTQLGIALISLLVTISYLMLKQSFSKNIRLLLIIVITLVVLFFTVSFDSAFFNILNQRDNSEEQLTEANGRTQLWGESLKNLTSKPFGWEMSSDISKYSHNLWLDVDRVAGIIPFIFLLSFSISCIYLVTKSLKISPQNLYFNTTILVWFIGFMAVFFVEPVIDGMFHLFLIFCIYIGLLSGLSKLPPPKEVALISVSPKRGITLTLFSFAFFFLLMTNVSQYHFLI